MSATPDQAEHRTRPARGPTAHYEIVRVLDAPREEVFRAWTEPEHFARWFGARGFVTPPDRLSLDVRPGGLWRAVLVSEDGFEVTLDGTYREVRAPERLVFTTGDPDDADGGPASVVTVILTDRGDRTEMRFHQYGVNTDDERATAARTGWTIFFDRLAENLS
jgi:uncharacterized protein YndB with AHSA1/START domain